MTESLGVFESPTSFICVEAIYLTYSWSIVYLYVLRRFTWPTAGVLYIYMCWAVNRLNTYTYTILQPICRLGRSAEHILMYYTPVIDDVDRQNT
jgi:hypothetical protein